MTELLQFSAVLLLLLIWISIRSVSTNLTRHTWAITEYSELLEKQLKRIGDLVLENGEHLKEMEIRLNRIEAAVEYKSLGRYFEKIAGQVQENGKAIERLWAIESQLDDIASQIGGALQK